MSTCEARTCSNGLPKDENMNCINNCTSPACYNEIYGKEPLEDGNRI
jgi:hypothetical protein